MKKATGWLGTSILAAALALGCSAPGGPADAGSGGGDASDAATESAKSDLAPDFELDSLEGETFRLADSAGKVRLVDFWATWCAPCREEVPMLQALHNELGGAGFQLIAISDEESADQQAFVDEHGIDYLMLVDPAGAVGERYRVPGLPTAYLIDGEGTVVETFLGEKPERILRKRIDELLARNGEQAALID